jgi:uncharacterized protein YbjT (DUF2867 family)
MANVFITGASGFMGRRLSAELVARGHSVRGLVRRGSEKHLALGCEGVTGDPLDASTYQMFVAGCDTLVHLVGVAHPSPAKKQQFRTIDLASATQALAAAGSGGVRHMVYVSVAHPAPVMRDYIAARTEAEDAIRKARVNATILRPWYVLGPGRRWPLTIAPLYWLLEALPGTRESARRLGLVSVEQMIATMARAIADPPSGVRVWEVPEIRLMGT